ncbi:MAG: undecaprenyl-diphosphate phosphatase [Candidatus Eremiobacterota bacterium]
MQIPPDLQAVVLGVIQGLTEFLPISSSAHLVLLPVFGHWAYMGKTFDVALHLGTLVAILAYFRGDVLKLLRGVWRLALERRFCDEEPERKLALLIVLGTIPAGMAGLLFDDFIEEHLQLIPLIAANLMVFGLILEYADRSGLHQRRLASLRWMDALLVGCAQMLALVPGVSRSGSTMTASLFLGLTREDSARFSFLLSLPITAAAVALKGKDLLESQAELSSLGQPIVIGTLASAISGFLCIHYLLKYLRTNRFTPFTVYRLALGILVLALWWSGTIVGQVKG